LKIFQAINYCYTVVPTLIRTLFFIAERMALQEGDVCSENGYTHFDVDQSNDYTRFDVDQSNGYTRFDVDQSNGYTRFDVD